MISSVHINARLFANKKVKLRGTTTRSPTEERKIVPVLSEEESFKSAITGTTMCYDCFDLTRFR